MKILITGAKGFVGKNLSENLKNIRDGKNRTRPELNISEIFEYDVDSNPEKLSQYCEKADFVFHIAGVNRPKESAEFMTGNLVFSDKVLSELMKAKNTCPVMLASSIQASQIDRYRESDYGKSKHMAEERFFEYGRKTGAKVLVYRFFNLFGKWSRPNYNSVVATFCHNIANDLPIQINDPAQKITLSYIDDVVEEMLSALSGKECHCDFDGLTPVFSESGRYCTVPVMHETTLKEISELLHTFHAQPASKTLPEIPEGSFGKKLYSTYLSYLPESKICFPLTMNEDARGSLTEILKTASSGQFSVNVSNPGVTKGEHWHNSKWEFFIVVSGRARIMQRKIGSDEVLTFDVSGEKMECVYMLPGYTHNIINLSDTEKLITLMWANEQFDKDKPDTFYERVEKA